MSKETAKQMKARLINEISAKYSSKMTEMMVENAFLKNEVLHWREQVSNLKEENRELKDKVEKFEDWNRRLQEFMDMEPEERETAFKTMESNAILAGKMNTIFSMYSRFFGM